MTLDHYTAIAVSLNVVLAAVATWQRHVTVREALRKQRKRLKNQSDRRTRK